MKLTKTFAAALSGLAISAAALATPAAAVDDPTPTVATVTLTGGSLSIDGPATAAGSASVEPGSPISVTLATTTVVDNRGTLLGWTATGASTDFVKPAVTEPATPAYTMPKALFTWATTNLATTNGDLTGVSAAPSTPLNMAAPFAVANALVTKGAGTYTYGATVQGTVPVNMITGAYAATITQSVI